ncbi:hypothetical protein HK405_006144, partial [Cladochytrium tenue]
MCHIIRLSHKGRPAANPDDPVWSPPASSTSPHAIPWTIDTKYYTAEVAIWLDETAGAPSAAAVSAYAASADITAAVDALVFVYDRAHPDSFVDLRAWAEFVDAAAPSVLLCVAAAGEERSSGGDGGADVDDDHVRWCVENGFEFVDLLEEPPDDDGGDDGVGGAEKFGAERVLEALEANMWASMVRKGRGPASASAVDGRPKPEDSVQDLGNADGLEEEDEFQDFQDADIPSLSEARQLRDALFGGASVEDDDFFERTVDQLRELR